MECRVQGLGVSSLGRSLIKGCRSLGCVGLYELRCTGYRIRITRARRLYYIYGLHYVYEWFTCLESIWQRSGADVVGVHDVSYSLVFLEGELYRGLHKV